MNKVQEFIDLVGQGQNAQAQESLNDILSAKAFEALESFKQNVGANLFATEETEQLDEISLDKASDAYAARVQRANDSDDDAEFDKHLGKVWKTGRHIGARYGSTGMNKAERKSGNYDGPGYAARAKEGDREFHAIMKKKMAD